MAPKTWTEGAGGATNLSWAGASHLAVNWLDTDQSRSGLRIPDTAGPSAGSVLAASRLVVPARQVAGSAQITQDGSTVLDVVQASGEPQLAEYAASSSRLLKRVPLAGRAAGQSAAFCGVLWSSRTGGQLFSQCGGVQRVITDGRAVRARLAMSIRPRWSATPTRSPGSGGPVPAGRSG
jgi:hypothetical protein